jgi:hypothetical protein
MNYDIEDAIWLVISPHLEGVKCGNSGEWMQISGLRQSGA